MTAEGKRVTDFTEQVKGLLQKFTTNQTLSMADVMAEMPPMTDDDVDLFLTASLRQRWYDCAILAAVRYDRTEQIVNFNFGVFNLGGHLLTHRFCSDVVKYLANEKGWPLLEKLLLDCCECQVHRMVKWFSTRSLSDENLLVFEKLLDCCSVASTPLIDSVISDVCSFGLAPQFKVLVNSNNRNIRQALTSQYAHAISPFLHLVHANYEDRHYHQDFPDVTPDHNGCLAVACEAGLSSVSPWGTFDTKIYPMFTTPIALAVHLNQPDLVQFLYRYGTVSNHELFQLCHDPKLVERSKADPARQDAKPSPPDQFPSEDDGHAARQIRSFLLQKASQPQSLGSLCLREVNTLVDWGHNREARVDQLEIPDCLKNALKFKGARALLKYKSK